MATTLNRSNLLDDQVLLEDWLVACRSVDVKEQPIQIKLMGERLVIFRNSKGVHAFKDLCCHRGAALSLGEVKNDCIVCPYHGWEYDETGACVHIPQLPEGRKIPTQAKAFKYSSIEKYGLIWVNFAGNEPEMFRHAESEDDSFHHVIWGPQKAKAKPPRVAENFLDVGHLAVVHEGSLGSEEHREIKDYKVHEKDGRIYSDEIPVYQPDADGTGKAKVMYYTYEILRPCTVKFSKRDPEDDSIMSITFTIRPVDEETSVAYAIESFNYDTGLTDEQIVSFQDEIFEEDKPIIENQKPEELPLDLQVELSLVCDRMSIAYRQYLKKLGVKLGVE